MREKLSQLNTKLNESIEGLQLFNSSAKKNDSQLNSDG